MAKFDLKDATVIVTGGSRGIGPYIAEALAGEGAKVALVARNAEELTANAQRLGESGAVVVPFAADVTSAEQRRELIEAVERLLGPVDALVNNAGGDLQREFHNLGEDEIQGVLELNLTSAVMLTRLVLPGMLQRGRGHIVNVSSMAGRLSFPYTEAYAAAKDGLTAFTRVFRADYRDQGVSGSNLILGAVGEAGVGARTAEEVGIKLPPVGLVTPTTIGKLTVRAIRLDKAGALRRPGDARHRGGAPVPHDRLLDSEPRRRDCVPDGVASKARRIRLRSGPQAVRGTEPRRGDAPARVGACAWSCAIAPSSAARS